MKRIFKRQRKKERKLKILEAILSRISFPKKKDIIAIIKDPRFSNIEFLDLSGIKEEDYDSTDYLDYHIIPALSYLLKLCLIKRGVNPKRYEDSKLKKYKDSNFDFYVSVRVEKIIAEKNFDLPEIAENLFFYNECLRLYHLKPQGEVLEEFLKLQNETK